MPKVSKETAEKVTEFPVAVDRSSDLDGYTVVLASPYGTADGRWKPEPGGPFKGR